MSSQSAVGLRTLRVPHLRQAVRLIDSELHTMQVLTSSNPRNFAAGVAQPARGPCVRAPAPVPSARAGGCVTLTFPYDTTNCLDPSVQGSWALWAGAMRYVDELRIDGVLRRSYSPGPTPVSVPDSDRLLLGTILTSHNAPRRLCSSQAPWWRRMYGG